MIPLFLLQIVESGKVLRGILEFGPIFIGDIVVHLDFIHNNIVTHLDKKIRVKLSLLRMFSLSPGVFDAVETYIQGFNPAIF